MASVAAELNLTKPYKLEDMQQYTSWSDFDSIKFLHENGAPWDYNVMNKILDFSKDTDDYLEILKYLFENGCPYRLSDMTDPGRTFGPKIKEYIDTHIIPAGEYTGPDFVQANTSAVFDFSIF